VDIIASLDYLNGEKSLINAGIRTRIMHAVAGTILTKPAQLTAGISGEEI
jgi:hypothetical protein